MLDQFPDCRLHSQVDCFRVAVTRAQFVEVTARTSSARSRTTVASRKDCALNLPLIQEDSSGGEGRDDHTIKWGRIPSFLDFRDLCVKVCHHDSTALLKYLPCASNIAVKPDQLHAAGL